MLWRRLVGRPEGRPLQNLPLNQSVLSCEVGEFELSAGSDRFIRASGSFLADILIPYGRIRANVIGQ